MPAGRIVRAPGRVTYIPPSERVRNPSRVDAHDMAQFVAKRDDVLHCNVVSVLQLPKIRIKIYYIIKAATENPICVSGHSDFIISVSFFVCFEKKKKKEHYCNKYSFMLQLSVT